MNVKENTYKLFATLQDGTIMDLTNAVEKLEWSDPNGELAQRASIKLAQVNTSVGLISSVLSLCVRLQIVANGEEVFEGLIWDWEYTSGSTKEFSVTGYDNMIYMQKSKDNNYFSNNQKTQTIVSSICKKHGITLKYNWGNYKHKKTVYRGQTIANQIIGTLEDAKYKIDKRYVVKYSKGALIIEYPGQNNDVYVFEGEVIATSHKQSMDKLITKVLITGKESKSGKIPIKATVNGKTEYGVIQEMVSSTSTSVSEAKAEAKVILKERGKPEETIRMDAPDIPTLRKGDKIKVKAGSLNGYYFVIGVTHNANDRIMNLELEVAGDGL